MIKLYDKETHKIETIYAILDDDHGYPKFLIRNGNRWMYRSAKHYVPQNEALSTLIDEGCILPCDKADKLNKKITEEKRLLKILGAHINR